MINNKLRQTHIRQLGRLTNQGKDKDAYVFLAILSKIFLKALKVISKSRVKERARIELVTKFLNVL